MARKSVNMTIVVRNLPEHEALALESFLAMMQKLGKDGSSRWLAFYADGDGTCRPWVQVQIDEGEMHDAKVFPGLEAVDGIWTRSGEFRLDPDIIASLRNQTSASKPT